MRQAGWIVMGIALACATKHHGRTKPSQETDWYRCEVVPDKREVSSTEIGFVVRCNAKVDLGVYQIETVLYDGDDPSNLGPKNLFAEDEVAWTKKGQVFERRGSFRPAGSIMHKPWVVHARIFLRYPAEDDGGEPDAEKIIKSLQEEEKLNDAHPEHRKALLHAAVP